MKQFWKILKFEFKNYLYNKVFVGVTLVLVIVMAGIMFFPRISALFDNGGEEVHDDGEEAPVMLILSENGAERQLIGESFSAAFTDYTVEEFTGSADELKEKIKK